MLVFFERFGPNWAFSGKFGFNEVGPPPEGRASGSGLLLRPFLDCASALTQKIERERTRIKYRIILA